MTVECIWAAYKNKLSQKSAPLVDHKLKTQLLLLYKGIAYYA